MATWKPDAARLSAIKRSRSWYTGQNLDSDSGVLFWSEGSPTRMWTDRGPEQRESRIHVPVAADIALTAADFLFGAGVNVTADDDADDELLTEVKGKVLPLLGLGADRASGLGEVYYRMGWEDETATLSLVDAAKVSPVWRAGTMVKATVRYELGKHDGHDYVHYETYEPGTILHELYMVDQSSKEVAVPLSRHPETLRLIAGVEDMAIEDQMAAMELKVDLPPAMSDRMALEDVLNREPRDGRQGGASDTEGNEGLMGAVDQAITSLDRDVRLGKARIIVDQLMLNRDDNALKGIRFDTTAEIFAPIQAMNYKGELLQIVQFDIRAEAHLATARDAIRRVVALAGYSPESLVTDQSQAPEAASARRLREARSLRTTGSKADRWIPKLERIIQGMMVIQASLRNVDMALPEISVELREAISPDLSERAILVVQLVAAKVMARRTGIQMLHPDWDDVRVNEELRLIAEDGPDLSLGGIL